MRRVPAMLLAGVLTTSLVTACQSTGSEQGTTGGRFGAGFTPDDRVVLQDDVVVVQGGSNAIRAASADGLTWYVDPDAAGADDVAVGDVMIATSRAVGRVVDVQESGQDLRVMLVPVTIGELFKDVELKLDTPLDLSAMKVQEMTAPAGAEESEATGANDGVAGRVAPAQTADGFTRVVSPTLTMAGQPADPMDDTLLPPKDGAKFKGSVGSWEVELYFDKTGIGFKVQYKAAGKESTGEKHDASVGLKFGFDVKMKSRETPRVSGEMRVVDGKAAAPTMKVDGFSGVDVNVYAGAPRGKHDDVKVRMEVPVELYVDVPPIYGVPTAVSIKFKFTVDVFMRGNNATLSGLASYGLARSPFSLITGEPTPLDFAVDTAMINTLNGLSLAPSGATFGVETRVLWGLGYHYAHIGPFVKVAMSWGVGIGSALFPYYECKLSRLRVDVGGGVGVAFNNKSYLAKVLKGKEEGLLDKLKIDIEFGSTKTVVDKKAWGPADKAPCAAF